jgi:hypothetical protein
MSKRFSKFIQLGIIGIWLCLVCMLVYRHYISGEQISSLQSLSGSKFKTSEEWFGIYAGNEKLGYVKTSSEKIGNEYRFTQYGETGNLQQDKSLPTIITFTCLTDLDYRIKSFEFETRSGDTFIKSRGELDEDNVLLVFVETEKEKKTEAIDIPGSPYLYATVKHMLYAKGLEKGKRFKVPVLNIFSLGVDETIVEVQDLVPVKVGISVHTAYVLKIGGTYSWISDGGTTLKEANADGLLYLSETETSAKSKDDQYIFDYLSIHTLKSNKLLPYPENLSSLKIRLSGIDPAHYPLLNEGRQTLNGNVLEIDKEPEDELKENTYDLPYGNNDLELFLAPDNFVQSDHHTIIYNADKFAAIEKNAFRLARFLTSNLYLTMGKSPMFHLRKSMDIFNKTLGESNDHTVMFTAFARAGGLPVRMAGGLVYLKGRFYYHAWPEVWIGRWVPADPTLGQFPADVTHIRFVAGEIDHVASFGAQIKDIKVEILEAS